MLGLVGTVLGGGLLDGVEDVRVEDVGVEGVEDGGLHQSLRDGFEGAGCEFLAIGADVGLPVGALGDVEGGAAAGAVEDAGEEPGRVCSTPAWVVLATTGEVFVLVTFGEDGLGEVPSGGVNDGVTVVFDNKV